MMMMMMMTMIDDDKEGGDKSEVKNYRESSKWQTFWWLSKPIFEQWKDNKFAT